MKRSFLALLLLSTACSKPSPPPPDTTEAPPPLPPPLPAKTIEPGLFRFPFRAFEGGGLGVPPSIASSVNGEVVIAGSASPGLDFGAGAMKGGASYLCALGADGNMRWRWVAPNGDLEHLGVDGTGRARVLTSEGLVALDANGKEQWKRTFEGHVRSVHTARDGGVLVVADADNATTATKVDADGKDVWSQRLDRKDDASSTGTMNDEGVVAIAWSTSLTKLAKDGKPAWTKEAAKTALNLVAFDGDDILAAGDGTLVRIDAKDKITKRSIEGFVPSALARNVVIGAFQSDVDFGTGKQTPKNGRGDTAIVVFEPSLKTKNVRTYPFHIAEAAFTTDSVWLTSPSQGNVTLDDHTLTPTSPELVVYRVKL